MSRSTLLASTYFSVILLSIGKIKNFFALLGNRQEVEIGKNHDVTSKALRVAIGVNFKIDYVNGAF